MKTYEGLWYVEDFLASRTLEEDWSFPLYEAEAGGARWVWAEMILASFLTSETKWRMCAKAIALSVK
jgi:hypothetical protein